MFISTDNTIYVVETELEHIQIWSEGSSTPMRNFSRNLYNSTAIYVVNNGDVYVSTSETYYHVEQWTLNSTNSTIVMYADNACYSIFVDVQNSIYCSVGYLNKVTKKLSHDYPNTTRVVAGNGTGGSSANMLKSIRGIFVDQQLNLYVADTAND